MRQRTDLMQSMRLALLLRMPIAGTRFIERTSAMTNHKYIVPPAALVRSTAVASVFATFMASRLRHARQSREKAVLAGGEDKGGSMAAPGATARLP